MSHVGASIATAEAMLNAGNTAAARRHIDEALREQPKSIAAFLILFRLTLQDDKKAALALADQWLENDPKSVDLQTARFVALVKNKKKRESRRMLNNLRDEMSNDPRSLAKFELMYTREFEDSTKTRKKIAQIREEFGNEEDLDRADMLARMQSDKMVGTTKAAERVLEQDSNDALAHLVIAAQSFRAFRFKKARKHAEEICRIEPDAAPIAKEIIWSTYLVYFPPFFIAHLFALIWRFGIGWLGWAMVIVAYFGGVVLLLLFHIPAMIVQSMVPIPYFYEIWYGSLIGWIAYQFWGFAKVGMILSNRKGSVALNPNY